MEQTQTYKYSLGFIFDAELQRVLLVHKEKPEWQKGRVNGIGGKFESGETPAECISRETIEESSLAIAPDEWVYVGALHQEIGDVAVLAAKYSGRLEDAIKNDYEEVGWFDVNALPSNVIENLKWLVPVSLEKLKGTFE